MGGGSSKKSKTCALEFTVRDNARVAPDTTQGPNKRKTSLMVKEIKVPATRPVLGTMLSDESNPFGRSSSESDTPCMKDEPLEASEVLGNGALKPLPGSAENSLRSWEARGTSDTVVVRDTNANS